MAGSGLILAILKARWGHRRKGKKSYAKDKLRLVATGLHLANEYRMRQAGAVVGGAPMFLVKQL